MPILWFFLITVSPLPEKKETLVSPRNMHDLVCLTLPKQCTKELKPHCSSSHTVKGNTRWAWRHQGLLYEPKTHWERKLEPWKSVQAHQYFRAQLKENWTIATILQCGSWLFKLDSTMAIFLYKSNMPFSAINSSWAQCASFGYYTAGNSFHLFL